MAYTDLLSNINSLHLVPINMWGVCGGWTSEQRRPTIIDKGVVIPGNADMEWLSTLLGDFWVENTAYIMSNPLVGNISSYYKSYGTLYSAGSTEYSYYNMTARANYPQYIHYWYSRAVRNDSITTLELKSGDYTYERLTELQNVPLTDVILAIRLTNTALEFGYYYNEHFYPTSERGIDSTIHQQYDYNDALFPAILYPRNANVYLGQCSVTPAWITGNLYVYAIPNENGTAVISDDEPSAGDIVNVTISSVEGMTPDPTKTTLTSSVGVLPIWDSETTFHFEMPSAPVIINLGFIEAPEASWDITIADAVGGSTRVDRDTDVPKNTLVTVYFTPITDYYVNQLRTYVMTSEGSIPLLWLDSTHATFFTPNTSRGGTIVIYPQYNSVNDDPYDGGGTSGPGGGDGNFDDSSDPTPLDDLPLISAASSGMITIFNPTISQLRNLGAYLWTNFSDFIENMQKLFSNPMDYFVAFHIMPCSPEVGEARNIKLGLWETNIQMAPVLSQWYEFDCGTITVEPYSNTMLDYAPYTKISLMLPFIGNVQLNTDEVMGKQLQIKYRMDLVSGTCVAVVLVNGDVYYQFTGECSVSIPLTGADWSRIYSAAIGAVGTAISGGIAAGAAGAGATAGGSVLAASVGTRAINAVVATSRERRQTHPLLQPDIRENVYQANQAAMSILKDTPNIQQQQGQAASGIKAAAIAKTVANSVGQVASGKLSVQHSGSISGSAGLLGNRSAYIIIEYPNQSLPENYNQFVGFPCNMYVNLGTLSGYTECEQIIAAGIPGTDSEYAELVDALKNGVYL